MRHTACLAVFLILLGCQSTPAARGTAATPAPMVCPVTGRTVEGEGASAYYGVYEIICVDREAANQFGSLPVRKRAQLAGPQVMARQGITNSTCPLTGKPLDAEAVAVTYEGRIYGFACLADANQFTALPRKKQASIIADFNAAAGGGAAAKQAS
jgi:hypothetical protein